MILHNRTRPSALAEGRVPFVSGKCDKALVGAKQAICCAIFQSSE